MCDKLMLPEPLARTSCPSSAPLLPQNLLSWDALTVSEFSPSLSHRTRKETDLASGVVRALCPLWVTGQGPHTAGAIFWKMLLLGAVPSRELLLGRMRGSTLSYWGWNRRKCGGGFGEDGARRGGRDRRGGGELRVFY